MMRHKELSEADKDFVEEVRSLEETLFPDQLCPHCPEDMKSRRKYCHFRPSHHFRTGLINKDDVRFLSQHGKRLLSVGAYPAYLEKTLRALGVPPDNIVLADNEPALGSLFTDMQTIVMDVRQEWPDIGAFDRIIFPESLGVSVLETAWGTSKDLISPEFPSVECRVNAGDTKKIAALTAILLQSVTRLNPEGIVRANGAMPHPHVMGEASLNLEKERHLHELEYYEYFLSLRKTQWQVPHKILDHFRQLYRRWLQKEERWD